MEERRRDKLISQNQWKSVDYVGNIPPPIQGTPDRNGLLLLTDQLLREEEDSSLLHNLLQEGRGMVMDMLLHQEHHHKDTPAMVVRQTNNTKGTLQQINSLEVVFLNLDLATVDTKQEHNLHHLLQEDLKEAILDQQNSKKNIKDTSSQVVKTFEVVK